MKPGAIRLDKWLWAVRLFKTRTLAIEACRAGHVRVGGERAKPARLLTVGDLLSVQVGGIDRTIRVLGVVERRVGAARVPGYLEDLTPPEDLARRREARAGGAPVWERGKGRPTKRDRRRLEGFFGAE